MFEFQEEIDMDRSRHRSKSTLSAVLSTHRYQNVVRIITFRNSYDMVGESKILQKDTIEGTLQQDYDMIEWSQSLLLACLKGYNLLTYLRVQSCTLRKIEKTRSRLFQNIRKDTNPIQQSKLPISSIFSRNRSRS